MYWRWWLCMIFWLFIWLLMWRLGWISCWFCNCVWCLKVIWFMIVWVLICGRMLSFVRLLRWLVVRSWLWLCCGLKCVWCFWCLMCWRLVMRCMWLLMWLVVCWLLCMKLCCVVLSRLVVRWLVLCSCFVNCSVIGCVVLLCLCLWICLLKLVVWLVFSFCMIRVDWFGVYGGWCWLVVVCYCFVCWFLCDWCVSFVLWFFGLCCCICDLMLIELVLCYLVVWWCEFLLNDFYWIIMMNFVEIKVFVFDVFGMIVDWRSGVVCGVVVFLDCYVLMFVLFVFVDVWCVEYLLLMEEICSGCCCYVWFDVLYCENFVCMFDCFGIDDVFDVDIDVFNFVWYWFDLWFDVVVGLYWLK